MSENTEINNNTNTPNNEGINNGNYFEEEKVIIQKPNVIEITIPQPKAEGKKRPKPIATLKEERFVF